MIFCCVVAALALLAGIAGGCVATRMGEGPTLAERAYFATLPNYADGVFVNREPQPVQPVERARRGYLGFLRMLGRSDNAPDFELPAVELTRDAFPAEAEEFAVYWLGHSTLIFELGGVRFMTDPVFGNASPVPGFLSRYREPPLARRELPEIDFVILTHDHYDHLEYATIADWASAGFDFITPLGVGARLRGWGVAPERIHELNWDESIELAGIEVTAVTSRHFSGRSTGDRNQTLWAAFVIAGGGRRIFFSGDGGYGGHFREIGEGHGPFDLVCMEIDAWNENWPNTHIFPDQAVLAHRELGGAVMLPMHWGVFDMAMHPWDESIRMVAALADAAGVELVTPKMGEKWTPGDRPERWWENKQ